MGQEATLEQITPQQLAEFLEDLVLAYDYIRPDYFDDPASLDSALDILKTARGRGPDMSPDANRILNAAADRIGTQMLQQVKRQAARRRAKGQQATAKKERKQLYLYKYWGHFHFLLNGTSAFEPPETPLQEAIVGGTLSSFDAKQISVRLAELSKEDAMLLYGTADLEVRDPDGEEKWFWEIFREFADFYRDAAERGNAMLLRYH